MDTATETKLAAARTRLILDKPFLGALVLRLPLVAADAGWCQTAMTDAKQLYYNPSYFQNLDTHQSQFVLAKHALHCAFSHFARRQHRIKSVWDRACDYAVNPLLIQDGLTPPAGVLVDERFDGLTAEEIYPLLERPEIEETESEGGGDVQAGDSPHSLEEEPEASLSTDGKDPGRPAQTRNQAEHSGDKSEPGDSSLARRPAALTPQERERLSVQWQQRLVGAAQMALRADRLGGGLARMVQTMRYPSLPWRALLARYMTASARDDYAYSRPSSRRGDPAIFPSLRSAQINIAIGVDVSGSVKDEEMNAFLSEVDAVKGTLRARITLLPCDYALVPDAPWVFEPWEDVSLPDSLTGGGGTSFAPVFDWVNSQDQQPDLLVYFTDGKGTFPSAAPAYPVIWLVKGNRQVPWGERVQLN